jgi:hypothetical protein
MICEQVTQGRCRQSLRRMLRFIEQCDEVWDGAKTGKVTLDFLQYVYVFVCMYVYICIYDMLRFIQQCDKVCDGAKTGKVTLDFLQYGFLCMYVCIYIYMHI